MMRGLAVMLVGAIALTCHAAPPALDRPQPEVAKAAVDVLDGCVKGFESGYQPEPTGTLLVLLARRQWQLGDVPPGGRHVLTSPGLGVKSLSGFSALIRH